MPSVQNCSRYVSHIFHLQQSYFSIHFFLSCFQSKSEEIFKQHKPKLRPTSRCIADSEKPLLPAAEMQKFRDLIDQKRREANQANAQSASTTKDSKSSNK